MDTSSEVTATDTRCRSVPPRRYRTIEEKRRIVEETMARGASVAVIARRHEVNANLVFGWRKLYQQGLLGTAPKVPATPLLPVRLSGARAVKGRRPRYARRAAAPRTTAALSSSIEIELAGGGCVRVHGEAVSAVLAQLIEALCRR
jgi:transposase